MKQQIQRLQAQLTEMEARVQEAAQMEVMGGAEPGKNLQHALGPRHPGLTHQHRAEHGCVDAGTGGANRGTSKLSAAHAKGGAFL